MSGCQTFGMSWRLGWHQRVLRSQLDNRFTEINCSTFELPNSITNPICGYVTVPERHDQPQGNTVALGVVLLPKTSPSPSDDPLVLATGMPGQSTIHALSPWFVPNNPAVNLRSKRDILLIEPRGSRYSRPYLDCPELDPVRQDLLETGQLANPQAREQLEKPAHQECRDRLAASGIDFDAYNALEQAADIVSVLDSIGFRQVNFYGTDHGSLIAQLLMQQYPQRLRTVILDGTEPTSVDSRQYVVQSGSYSLRQIFSNCLANAECNQAYPNLESIFLQLVDRLDDSPQPVTVNLGNEVGELEVPLSGAMFSVLIQSQLDDAAFVAALPQNLYRADQQNTYNWLSGAIALQAQTSTADAARASIMCAQRNAPEQTNAIIQSFFDPVFPQLETPIRANHLLYCDVYDVATLPESAYRPVTSDIPTLVMNGQYDNITPLAFGILVANTLPQSYVYQYPGLGHGALTVSFATGETCPSSMVSAFLDNPEQPPNETCIQQMMTTYELTPTEPQPEYQVPNSLPSRRIEIALRSLSNGASK